MLRSWEEWYEKVFPLLWELTCSKLAKKPEIYLSRDYFKIGQNFDIYFFTIDFIWSLGIYNCYKDHREVEKSDIKKFFSLF